MGQLINKARRCVEKIEYYHKYGGVYGYKQAKYRYWELGDLMRKAKNNGDLIVIQELTRSVGTFMEEMKKRAPEEE